MTRTPVAWLNKVCACLIALLGAGCATISNGPMQRLDVDSIPSSATVVLKECGLMSTSSAVTPATVSVARKATRCRLHFALPGHQESVVRLERRASRDSEGNLRSLGSWCSGCGPTQLAVMTWFYLPILIPSLAVDFTTGSIYELTPERVRVPLRPEPAGNAR